MSTAISEKHRSFDTWMSEVDEACYQIADLSVWDLPDCPFACWYGHYTARAAAKKALREAGW